NVTSKYNELYELYPGYERFNQFIPKYSESFEEEDLLNLTKILIAKFADLHLLKIAHRDVASHSLWFSPSKAVAISNFISAYHQPTGTIGDYRSSLSVSPIEFKGM
ncbi:hypothetical protein QP445_13570, partial [Micrococcus luteus]|nr:hypothetical protein [Micrococcus luteus]